MDRNTMNVLIVLIVAINYLHYFCQDVDIHALHGRISLHGALYAWIL
ncbi:hypothetical protein [Methanobacterium sp.]